MKERLKTSLGAPLAALIALLLVTAVTGAPATARAADWDPFPELEPGDRVAIRKRFDGPRYDDLRECYRDFDSAVGANYFAAMVDVTDEGGSRSRKKDDAAPYAAALSKAWAEAERLDPEKDVVVVVGIRNRSIAVQAGSRWIDLGFEGEVMADALAAAEAQKQVSRRRYIDALCGVLPAIDHRLVGLRFEKGQRVEAAKARTPGVEEALAGVREKLDGAIGADHPFGKTLSSRLDEAAKALEAARAATEEKPGAAMKGLDEVEAAIEEVETRLNRYQADMEAMDAADAELAEVRGAVEARGDRDWEDPQAALARLAECEATAAKIRESYEGAPALVYDCLREVDHSLGRADVRHRYLAGLLPVALLLLLLALAVAFVVARLRRRQRLERLLRPDLSEWERRLKHGGARRAALAEDFAELMEPGRLAWQGHSAETGRAAADALGKVDALLEQGADILRQAAGWQAGSRVLDVRKLDRALRHLREAPVTFGGRETPACTLLGELDDALTQAWDALEEAAELVDELQAEEGRADAAAHEAVESVEATTALEVDVSHLVEELSVQLDAHRRIAAAAGADPRGASGSLADLADRLERVCERARHAHHVVSRARGPFAERRDAVLGELRRLRLTGHRLEEPGFHPEDELDAIGRQVDRLLVWVEEGREAEARQALDELEARLQTLATRLAVVDEAATLVPAILDGLEITRKGLRSELFSLHVALGKREDAGRPGPVAAALAELDAVRTGFARADRWADGIREQHRNRKRLAATADLGEMVDLIMRAQAAVTAAEAFHVGQPASDVWEEGAFEAARWQSTVSAAWCRTIDRSRFGSGAIG